MILWIRIRIELKCWILIRIELIRIHNHLKRTHETGIGRQDADSGIIKKGIGRRK
jgi:hypothetical protein